MSGDTLSDICLALPFILSAIALWIVGPDTPEDDAHSIPHGDNFPIYPASHVSPFSSEEQQNHVAR
jgi:hypothetical protein